MKKSDSNNNGRNALVALLFAIPIVAVIVYFKLNTDDGVEETLLEPKDNVTVQKVAVPDTSTTVEYTSIVEDTTVYIAANDSVGIDTRPAMEAGDEDGYWDGWYDGAEQKNKQRYDEGCAFASQEDKDTYAKYYREGYEKGYKEAVSKRVK